MIVKSDRLQIKEKDHHAEGEGTENFEHAGAPDERGSDAADWLIGKELVDECSFVGVDAQELLEEYDEHGQRAYHNGEPEEHVDALVPFLLSNQSLRCFLEKELKCHVGKQALCLREIDVDAECASRRLHKEHLRKQMEVNEEHKQEYPRLDTLDPLIPCFASEMKDQEITYRQYQHRYQYA